MHYNTCIPEAFILVAQKILIFTIDSDPISQRAIELFLAFSGTNGGTTAIAGPPSLSSTTTSDFCNNDKRGLLSSSMHSWMYWKRKKQRLDAFFYLEIIWSANA